MFVWGMYYESKYIKILKLKIFLFIVVSEVLGTLVNLPLKCLHGFKRSMQFKSIRCSSSLSFFPFLKNVFNIFFGVCLCICVCRCVCLCAFSRQTKQTSSSYSQYFPVEHVPWSWLPVHQGGSSVVFVIWSSHLVPFKSQIRESTFKITEPYLVH